MLVRPMSVCPVRTEIMGSGMVTGQRQTKASPHRLMCYLLHPDFSIRGQCDYQA